MRALLDKLQATITDFIEQPEALLLRVAATTADAPIVFKLLLAIERRNKSDVFLLFATPFLNQEQYVDEMIRLFRAEYQALQNKRRGRQQAPHQPLPDRFSGVVVGNEVLDAMPVQLLLFDGQVWFERGVAAHGDSFIWADRPTSLRPPVDGAFVPGTVTEIHPQARAFVATLAERLQRGAAFFIDYGFPEAEYYLPQRHGGTLMCHRAHRADADPLTDIGEKDITAHVDFTGIALAAQDAGLDVIGYTTQAHFLMNCGLLEMLRGADLRSTANAQKLLTEHEMGELFKVIGLARGIALDPIGFARGDRTHTL